MSDDTAERETEFDRLIGRAVRLGIPTVSLVLAVFLGLRSGMAPALLALAASTLLAAVILLWSSLRSLVGDAPLDPGFDEAIVKAKTRESELRKRQVLRALKDLEQEREIGKIDEDDYVALVGQYRDTAKALLREIDAEIAPYREKAEQLIRSHLKKKGFEPKGALVVEDTVLPKASSERRDADPSCANCGTTNDADAAFCKKCGSKLAATMR